jgi:hypothetical protein
VQANRPAVARYIERLMAVAFGPTLTDDEAAAHRVSGEPLDIPELSEVQLAQMEVTRSGGVVGAVITGQGKRMNVEKLRGRPPLSPQA